MDYPKAIRIARALADVPQRTLAERISIDPSLISMLESGKRKPSLETLEKIASALGIPFHLFVLLGAEPQDSKTAKADDINQLAVGLAKLLLQGQEEDDPNTSGTHGRNPTDQQAQRIKPKPARTNSRLQRPKVG